MEGGKDKINSEKEYFDFDFRKRQLFFFPFCLPVSYLRYTLVMVLFDMAVKPDSSPCIYTVHLTRSLNRQTNTRTLLIFYLLKRI